MTTVDGASGSQVDTVGWIKSFTNWGAEKVRDNVPTQYVVATVCGKGFQLLEDAVVQHGKQEEKSTDSSWPHRIFEIVQPRINFAVTSILALASLQYELIAAIFWAIGSVFMAFKSAEAKAEACQYVARFACSSAAFLAAAAGVVNPNWARKGLKNLEEISDNLVKDDVSKTMENIAEHFRPPYGSDRIDELDSVGQKDLATSAKFLMENSPDLAEVKRNGEIFEFRGERGARPYPLHTVTKLAILAGKMLEIKATKPDRINKEFLTQLQNRIKYIKNEIRNKEIREEREENKKTSKQDTTTDRAIDRVRTNWKNNIEQEKTAIKQTSREELGIRRVCLSLAENTKIFALAEELAADNPEWIEKSSSKEASSKA